MGVCCKGKVTAMFLSATIIENTLLNVKKIEKIFFHVCFALLLNVCMRARVCAYTASPRVLCVSITRIRQMFQFQFNNMPPFYNVMGSAEKSIICCMV